MARERSGIAKVTGAVTEKVIETIDPDTILEQVDIDALIQRVDIDALIQRVDLNALLDRIDVDKLLGRIDIDKLLSGADIEGLVKRSGIPDVVAASTGRFAGSAIDLARRQLVVLDLLIGKVVDGIFGRHPRVWSHAPARYRHEEPRFSAEGRLEVTGRYAGPLSRLIAAILDVWLMIATATVFIAGMDYLLQTLFDHHLEVDATNPWWIALGVTSAFLFVFLCIEIAGRTPGKALVGLRVVAWDGSPVGVQSAFWRTVVLPFSVLLLGLGCLLAIVQKDRRALHDLVARTAEVYDWPPRKVDLPPNLSRSLVEAASKPAAEAG